MLVVIAYGGWDDIFTNSLAEILHDDQAEVEVLWPQVTTENLMEISDYQNYKAEFLKLFGFGVAGVDYEADISPLVELECV